LVSGGIACAILSEWLWKRLAILRKSLANTADVSLEEEIFKILIGYIEVVSHAINYNKKNSNSQKAAAGAEIHVSVTHLGSPIGVGLENGWNVGFIRTQFRTSSSRFWIFRL
jgi:hypothetical protein